MHTHSLVYSHGRHPCGWVFTHTTHFLCATALLHINFLSVLLLTNTKTTSTPISGADSEETSSLFFSPLSLCTFKFIILYRPNSPFLFFIIKANGFFICLPLPLSLLPLSLSLSAQAQDFYVEMKWEFTSWGESRFCIIRAVKAFQSWSVRTNHVIISLWGWRGLFLPVLLDTEARTLPVIYVRLWFFESSCWSMLVKMGLLEHFKNCHH